MAETPPRRQDPIRDAIPELNDFSLVLGGPLYQLFRKAHIGGDVESHVRARVAVIGAIVWLPLLLLCALAGTLSGGLAVPFLVDVETHARLLIATPLMVVAELVVHRRIRGTVAQFAERGLVPAASMERFVAALRGAMSWRNSLAVELALVVLVYTLGYYLRVDVLALQASTWYAVVGPEGASLTAAGYWFTWVSNPIMQFLLMRWMFRLAIWARLLWQVSRLDLDLIPTHPDRNAGLGFLGGSAYAFAPVLTAYGAAAAGLAASRIFHEGASLTDFKLEIVSLVVVGMLLVLAPMVVFAPAILAAQRKGLRECGALAAALSRAFERRWLRGPEPDDNALLAAPDFSALSDFGNDFGVIREIKPLPFGRNTLVQLVAATLVPFVPLLFTVVPFEVMLDRVIKMIF